MRVLSKMTSETRSKTTSIRMPVGASETRVNRTPISASITRSRIMSKRILAMLLVLAMSASLLTVGALADGETVLAHWSLVSDEGAATAATLPQTAVSGVFASSQFSHYEKTDVSYTAGSKSIYTSGWDKADAEYKYWQIDTSSLGYENLAVSFNAWGSGTSPKSFTLQGSTDGSTFDNWESYELTSTANTEYNINLPAAAENQETLILRFVATGTVNINGAVVAAGGTSRMAEISITSSQSGGGDVPTKVLKPTATPADGTTAADGETVTLSCATDGAAIYYTVDGSVPTAASLEYTSPIVLSFGTESSVTIKAVAIKEELADSDIAAFTYYKQGTMTIANARK